MSEPPKTEKHSDRAATRGDAHNEQRKSLNYFFRLWPIAYLRYVQKQAKGQNSNKGKRDAYADAFREICLALIGSKIIQAAVVVMAFGLLWYILYRLQLVTDEEGGVDPNWVIAGFTIIMAVTTYLQWRAVGVANNEFVRQNRIMIKQIKQAEAASAQTDAMIEHMSGERRAYLTTRITTHGALFSAYGGEIEPDLPIVVRNSGKTPAVVTHAFVDIELYRQPSLDEIERKARAEAPRRTVIGPDETMVFNVNEKDPPLKISEGNSLGIARNTCDAYLVGGFIYNDAFGTEQKTLCCYKCRNASFLGAPIDGDMT